MKSPRVLVFAIVAILAVIGLAACSATSAGQVIPPTATSAPAAAATSAPSSSGSYGGGSYGGGYGQPTSAPSASSGAAAVTLQVTNNAKLGNLLTDGQGRTLYIRLTDSKNTSTCNGQCAQIWPPLMSSGQPTVQTGVNSSMVGQMTRTDGSKQVTYNGMPVYYYSADKAAGDANGEGIGNVWYVFGPDGNPIK